MSVASRFSICQLTTPHTSFGEDLRLYKAAGAAGFTVCESKLRADQDDSFFLELAVSSGLAVPICITACNSPLPAAPVFPGPDDLDTRVELMCAGLKRLAP